MTDNTDRALAVIWGNNAPDRYIPRAIPGRTMHLELGSQSATQNNGAWLVWDRKEKRFLTDAQVAALTFKNVSEKFHES